MNTRNSDSLWGLLSVIIMAPMLRAATQQAPSTEIPRGAAAAAQSSEEQSFYHGSFALVIGIDHYLNTEEFPILLHARNDASGIRKILESDFGFSPDRIRFLADSEATADEIKSAINKWLPERICDPGDALILFFAGHGLVEPATNLHSCTLGGRSPCTAPLPSQACDIGQLLLRNALPTRARPLQ
jgi:hypothetical protein